MNQNTSDAIRFMGGQDPLDIYPRGDDSFKPRRNSLEKRAKNFWIYLLVVGRRRTRATAITEELAAWRGVKTAAGEQ